MFRTVCALLRRVTHHASDLGQTTAEYALVIMGAAGVATLLITWASTIARDRRALRSRDQPGDLELLACHPRALGARGGIGTIGDRRRSSWRSSCRSSSVVARGDPGRARRAGPLAMVHAAQKPRCGAASVEPDPSA